MISETSSDIHHSSIIAVALRSNMMGLCHFYVIYRLLLANKCCDFYGMMECLNLPCFPISGIHLIFIGGSSCVWFLNTWPARKRMEAWIEADLGGKILQLVCLSLKRGFIDGWLAAYKPNCRKIPRAYMNFLLVILKLWLSFDLSENVLSLNHLGNHDIPKKICSDTPK